MGAKKEAARAIREIDSTLNEYVWQRATERDLLRLEFIRSGSDPDAIRARLDGEYARFIVRRLASPVAPKPGAEIEVEQLGHRLDESGRVSVIGGSAAVAKQFSEVHAAITADGWGSRLAADSPPEELNAAAAELSNFFLAEDAAEAKAAEERRLEEFKNLDFDSLNGASEDVRRQACRVVAEALKRTHGI